MADAKLKAIITAEDRASKVLKQVGGSLDSVNSRIKNLKPTFQKMTVAGVAGFTALSAGIFKTVKDASELKSLEVSFNRLAKQAGVNTQELLSSLREASAGTVSQTNLILSSNRAFALGVGQDLETISTLMEVARLKGRAMGLDTTQAFNDIVTGIGRGSPLILDNLGITIKLGEAQEFYAQKLGKTVQELTDGEKKQALLNAVLESGRTELEEAGDVTLTYQERIQQVKANLADLSVIIGENFLPILEKVIEKITPVIEKVSEWVKQNPELTTKIIIVVTALTGLVGILGAVGLALLSVSGFVTGLMGVLTLGGAIFASTGVIILSVIAILAGLSIAVIKIKNDYGSLTEFFYQTWDGIKLIISEKITAIKDFLNNTWNHMSVGMQVFLTSLLMILTSGLLPLGLLIFKNWDAIKQTTMNIWNFITAFFANIWNSIKNTFSNAINSIISFFDPLLDKIERVANKLASLKNSIGGAVSKVGGSIGSLFGRAGGGQVSPNRSFIVGENGAELFIPSTYGTIHKDGSVGGGGITININGNSFVGREDIAEQIGDDIMRALKRQIAL